MEVRYHRVSVEIDDRVATTSVDEELYNPGDQRTEGTYLFPLPAGAHIDKFSMDINGTQTDAELLPADKARSLYEEIVRRRGHLHLAKGQTVVGCPLCGYDEVPPLNIPGARPAWSGPPPLRRLRTTFMRLRW